MRLLVFLHCVLLLTQPAAPVPLAAMNPRTLLDKAKGALHSARESHLHTSREPSGKISSADTPTTRTTQMSARQLPPPSAQEILKYRYHHGTNLGSSFVLEKWLTPSMFPDAAKTSSELAAVKASIQEIGMSATKEKWETHWRDWVTNEDIEWLVRVGHVTTVRIPIGYYTLGQNFVKETPFEPYAEIYASAIPILGGLIERFREQGIAVIIDFHALPGGANPDSHGGSTTGSPALWTTPKDRDLAADCIAQIAQNIADGHFGDAVAGLQLVNEAVFDAPNMYKWYETVTTTIRSIDPGVPIYISDAWNLNRAIKWAKDKNKVSRTTDYRTALNVARNPIIIDTHLYWCFDPGDIKKSPQQIIADVPTKLESLTTGNVMSDGAMGAIVGEYSDVMGESTWAQINNQSRPRLTAEFGQAQSQRYQEKAMGSFFWTWKMDWMPGGAWGFVEQTTSGAITPPAALLLGTGDAQTRQEHASGQMSARMSARATAHAAYWKRHAPRTAEAEQWRYDAGFETGWADAAAFFGARSFGLLLLRWDLAVDEARKGADLIGGLDLWILKRLVDSQMFGSSEAWKFEHGMREGIKEFRDMVGL